MKRLLPVLLIFLAFPVFASSGVDGLLNKITMRLTAEQWVTTKTALVSVTVNASVAGKGVDRIQKDVMGQLAKLSDAGKWRIVAFDRNVDSSGMETLRISAEARLPQSALSSLRTKAKSITKPGESYTIASIAFTPSDDEIRAANSELRSQIYQRANDELTQLNKTYPTQHFYIHGINFLSNASVVAQTRMYMAKTAANTAVLSVGGKEKLGALVVFAAMPQPVLKILTNK